jgi:hypothetical protein
MGDPKRYMLTIAPSGCNTVHFHYSLERPEVVSLVSKYMKGSVAISLFERNMGGKGKHDLWDMIEYAYGEDGQVAYSIRLRMD